MDGILRFTIIFFVFNFFVAIVKTDVVDPPEFGELVGNVTIPVGGEAIINCRIENLGSYKVAWIQEGAAADRSQVRGGQSFCCSLQVKSRTLLTVASHVITRNKRIGISHKDRRTWSLTIRNVTASDRGPYMCQINTFPMKSQVGYLEVVEESNLI